MTVLKEDKIKDDFLNRIEDKTMLIKKKNVALYCGFNYLSMKNSY